MIHFRLRDYCSVLVYRLLGGAFAQFGRRVRVVWPLRIIGSRFVRLEDDVTVQVGAYIEALQLGETVPRLTIRRGTRIGNHLHLICTRHIEIGAQVLIADRVYIADNRHEYADVNLPIMQQPLRQLADVEIGDGTWICENVCILGCRIGRNCVIGANSVVTRDIPDYCVALGAPAVPVRRYCAQSRRWRPTHADGAFAD
jgi:acetyltransferase-like isoleucine patch superfamily enzyme